MMTKLKDDSESTVSTENAYAADGVNVLEGDKFSTFAGKLCESTFGNSPYVEVIDYGKGHFRGLRSYRLTDAVPKRVTNTVCTDGVGTKCIITDAAGMYDASGSDLIAMSAMDLTRNGCLPLVFTNILDVKTLGDEGSSINEAFRLLMMGLVEASREIGVVMLRGETAELGPCVGTDNPHALISYNWGSSMNGICDPERIIDGEGLKSGQILVALRENGFRSNGLSAVRKAFKLKFGDNWWNESDAKKFMRQAAEPSVLYDKFLATVNGWYEDDFKPLCRMYAIAHITGGGIPSKLGEDILYPRGLSAIFDDLWSPPQIMKSCYEWRGLNTSSNEWNEQVAYGTFNGGQGAIVVIDSESYNDFCAIASNFGIGCKKAGHITATPSGKKSSILIPSGYSNESLVFTSK